MIDAIIVLQLLLTVLHKLQLTEYQQFAHWQWVQCERGETVVMINPTRNDTYPNPYFCTVQFQFNIARQSKAQADNNCIASQYNAHFAFRALHQNFHRFRSTEN